MKQESPYQPLHKIRIVTAASLFDGHDAAINIMRRIIQATGCEVIHLGHDRSVEEVVDCAIQEDVQAIAMTSYQGGHLEYFKFMYDLLKEKGAPHIKIFGGGGGTILPSEIKELMDYGKANPGKLNYGSSAPQVRLPSLAVLYELGVDAVHLPFPGAGPYMTAVASGTIDWSILGEVNAAGLRPRVIHYAITGKTRSLTLPDVPTFTELGFPKLFGPAYALAVRTGTPLPIIDNLAAAIALAMTTPEVKNFWAKANIEVRNDSAEVAKRTLTDRYKFYEVFAKNGSLKAE